MSSDWVIGFISGASAFSIAYGPKRVETKSDRPDLVGESADGSALVIAPQRPLSVSWIECEEGDLGVLVTSLRVGNLEQLAITPVPLSAFTGKIFAGALRLDTVTPGVHVTVFFKTPARVRLRLHGVELEVCV